MTGWDKSVVEYAEKGKVSKCPYCGSDNVKVEEHKGKCRDSLSLLCKNCKRGAHYDGALKE